MYTPNNSTYPRAFLHFKGFRLASTSTNFEIKTGLNYNFRAGYRNYPKLALKAGGIIDSAPLYFFFEHASPTLLGFSALATSVLVSMF
jgi:hypothetical protein